MSEKIYLGLTGSFGSGCSTLAKVLAEKENFIIIKLSDEIKEEARERGFPNDRKALQDLGNLLRQENGNGYLASKALEKATQSGQERIVFDGIRNIGEVTEFRKHPFYYLVAVDCSKENRWRRLNVIYDGNIRAFDIDDKRDKNEGVAYGQQVLRCVDEADILFINENPTPNPTPQRITKELTDRFSPFLGLITKDKLRNPNIHETMMTVASTLALQSHCIKRRVGAVLCQNDGYIISAAYNEVPRDQKTCLEECGMCYRDSIRSKQKSEILKKYKFCPLCSNELKMNGNGWVCQSCKGDISNLIPVYKALDKCRSLHAEETTILKATNYHINHDTTLYTTTFPCLQCAKRILHSGIKNIYYIDPYPEEESIIMLETGKVYTEKFQGVKAQAYYKLFYPYRESLEMEVSKGSKK